MRAFSFVTRLVLAVVLVLPQGFVPQAAFAQSAGASSTASLW